MEKLKYIKLRDNNLRKNNNIEELHNEENRNTLQVEKEFTVRNRTLSQTHYNYIIED